MKGGDILNKYKLVGKIKENGESQEDLAKAMGLSRASLNAKINGRACFTQPEIMVIKKHYNLSDGDLTAIFFEDVVS